MNLAKKIVTYVTIGAVSLVSLLLILMLCKLNIFGSRGWSVVLTFVCIGVGGFFAINGINMTYKNKLIGYISLALIAVSVFLIILSTWISIESNLYSMITWSLGLVSVLFTIIVSSSLDLGKNKLVWQIVVYSIVGISDIFTTLLIFGVLDVIKLITPLLILIILSVVGVIILKVFAKKNVSDTQIVEKDTIKISRAEYQLLLEKAKKYDEMVSNNDSQSQK